MFLLVEFRLSMPWNVH